MTGREPSAFGSLYYTDCLPGQGLDGGAGFQFQARSPGVGDTARRAVARGALYEVPTRWIRERRAVEEYPRSLAHVAEGGDGWFVTAAGRYLGKEAKGHRDGNQFTHAVVTHDRSSYGLLRPAQLWGAPWWAEGPAPTTTCPPVDAPPGPGRWDTATVRDRVRDDPRGPERLIALVSGLGALRGPDRRRVLLVTDDPGEAACWIAAATVLLDRTRALAVTFKIFATDPDRSPHDVVAVHPDWAAPYERGGGYLVFDLRTGALPDVDPSAEAAYWVPRFLDDGDPGDVVDAVELAGQLAPGADPGPGEVERTAAALAYEVEASVTPTEIARVAGWLEHAGPGVLDLLGAPLVESLAERSPDPAAVASLDATVVGRLTVADAAELGWDRTAVAVRRLLFAREVDAALRGGAPAAEQLIGLNGAADDSEEVARLEEVAIVDPHTAMTLAHRHLVAKDTLVERFAAWWADRPGTEPPAPWASSPLVVRALRRELDGRLGGPRAADTRAAVRQHWWQHPDEPWRRLPVLGDALAPPWVAPLDAEIARAAYRHHGEPRETALAALAGVVARREHRVDPWVGAWTIVLGDRPAATLDVRRVLAAAPAEALTEALARHAYASLTSAAGFDEEAQRALAILEKADWTPRRLDVAYPPRDPALATVLDRVRAGAGVEEAAELGRVLAGSKRVSTQDRHHLASTLRKAAPSVAGLILVHTGASSLRQKLADDLLTVAEGDADRGADPRSIALLVVFAVRLHGRELDRARRWMGRLRRVVTERAGAGDLDAVTALLREDADRWGDDGVLARWGDLLGSGDRSAAPPPARERPPAPRPNPPPRGARPPSPPEGSAARALGRIFGRKKG